MKTTVVLILVTAMSSVIFAQGNGWSVEGDIEAIFPSDGLWDKGLGGEVKLINWMSPGFGVGVCAGIANWDIDSDSHQFNPNIVSVINRMQTWDGDVQYIPLGVSVFSRTTPSSNGSCFGIEAGLRYMVNDSDMKLTNTDTQTSGSSVLTVTSNHDVDTDDGFVGRIAARAEVPLNGQQGASLFVTGGYQFDLSTGDARVDEGGVTYSQDLELAGFFANIGFAIPLN
jgi:opacity protein-like surface antigen